MTSSGASRWNPLCSRAVSWGFPLDLLDDCVEAHAPVFGRFRPVGAVRPVLVGRERAVSRLARHGGLVAAVPLRSLAT